MKTLLKDKKIAVLLVAIVAVYVTILYAGVLSAGGVMLQAIRYIGVFLCFLVVVSSYDSVYSQKDARLVTLAFGLTLASDATFLFAGMDELGVACFCFVHLTYIRRYKGRAFLPCLIALVTVLAFCLACAAAELALPYIYILGTTYAILLILATGYAFMADLPKSNSHLVKAGMIFFLLCDFNSMLSYLVPEQMKLNGLAAYMMWVFYLPALTLLALSVRRYGRQEQTDVLRYHGPLGSH